MLKHFPKKVSVLFGFPLPGTLIRSVESLKIPVSGARSSAIFSFAQ